MSISIAKLTDQLHAANTPEHARVCALRLIDALTAEIERLRTERTERDATLEATARTEAEQAEPVLAAAELTRRRLK